MYLGKWYLSWVKIICGLKAQVHHHGKKSSHILLNHALFSFSFILKKISVFNFNNILHVKLVF